MRLPFENPVSFEVCKVSLEASFISSFANFIILFYNFFCRLAKKISSQVVFRVCLETTMK